MKYVKLNLSNWADKSRIIFSPDLKRWLNKVCAMFLRKFMEISVLPLKVSSSLKGVKDHSLMTSYKLHQK